MQNALDAVPSARYRERVVFISAARQVWGAEVSLLTLAEAMNAGGVETALVAPEGELAERASESGVATVVSVAAGPRPDQGRPAQSWRLWRAYARQARPGDHLVVFSYYLMGLAPVFAPRLRRTGVRLCLDLHDTLESRKARWSVQASSRVADAVIGCSAFTAGQLAAHPHVFSLHRAVDPELLPRHDRARGGRPMRVGIVGRISPEKRHAVLIEAMARLGGDSELVVRGAGDGWSDDHVRHVLDAGHRRLGPRFVLEGRVPAREALADLDVVVVGNPREPMGRTVLEAQLSGVVAVVPDTGGAAELVADGRTGLVYTHDDPADLARVLSRLRVDPDLAARIRAHAGDHVARPPAYAADYLRLLRIPTHPLSELGLR